MVKGLDRLRSYFGDYQENYIIIGGTACEIRLESKGIDFRATKDIDMLLIIEAIDKEFLEKFWQFIRDGEYANRNIDQQERKFFRFTNPQGEDFPIIVELFSRKPEGITLPEDFHLTPIPTDEELSSLSAMLLHDDYYNFTIANCSVQDGLMVANELALITLKAKAYLNNLQRKAEGHEIRENDITKHKKDVLKLVATLTGNEEANCPDIIKNDIAAYIDLLKTEQPDIKGLAKEAGLGAVTLDEILGQLAKIFQL
ncbi:MAG: hypothetical protein JWR09_3719 [Mucilaginibacter sp.]|nr:hypothetical protein [Mucilaginibacter sp.]